MQLRPKRGRAGGFLGEAGQPSADAYDDADLAAAIAASLSAGQQQPGGSGDDAGGSGTGAGGSGAGPSTSAAAASSGLGGGGRRGGGRGNGLDDADLAAAIAASLEDQPGPSDAAPRPVVPLSSLGQAGGPMASLFAADGGRSMQVRAWAGDGSQAQGLLLPVFTTHEPARRRAASVIFMPSRTPHGRCRGLYYCQCW